ncbi:putative transcription factor C2H2 family [Helianthus annuus]|uniref:Transcription factor C2H2 family n=2 Tax=Helianthus annuus TaxID=4232 RepID=A0A9K3H9A2_HELAN|nr:putative transcription factor C2H2 family [Helianthus annuus]KAJ0476074.1 putative transcription factor C2H2 family [Helianthus annuus]KAJ0496878.1 putative transcription factor C2H2 family [Helianthus annuus]KAJ0662909.1 putative transcription factor C2H2 family [Helianthus annuus]KAJ0848282.1 putative transcription factor C2H2 family [Helianthus annuus]
MNHLTNISSNYNQPPKLSPYFTFIPFLLHIYTHHHESHSITLFPSISPITAMGFPVGYTDLYLPKLFLHLLTLLGLIRKLISSIFRFVGLSDFLEPEFSSDPTRNEQVTHFHSISALLIRELLPVVKFSELVDPPESCAVCLYEFEAGDEIRQLINCRHIFHQCCLDRWMDHDQKTCPLCRTTFVPHDLRDSFNERLWADSGVAEAECDSSLVSVRN